MDLLRLGLRLILVIMTLLVNTNADEKPGPAPKDDFLVYPVTPPSKIRKRDTSQKKMSDDDFHKLIEKKLMQHTQALEHLVLVAQNNEDLVKKLIENFSSYVPEPKMPDKLQMTSRRSFGGRPGPESVTPAPKISPWCAVASVCRRTTSPVCAYDDNFGYGKFDDVCHMLQVNCYWKYNFGLVAHCRPILN